MVNSTPIVIRSLTGVFPQSFRDLTLVAGTIGDYAALVVPADSPINTMEDLLAAYAPIPNGTSPSAAARCPAAWTTSSPRW
jgi:putative tricarboxylic transport membrane protein